MIDARLLPADVIAQMQATVSACGIAFSGSDEEPNSVEVVCNAATEAAAEVLKLYAQAWLDHLRGE